MCGRVAARARGRANLDAFEWCYSLGVFAARETASRSLFAVRDGIDHLLQLRLHLPGLHETLAVLPVPLLNLQTLLAHLLQERVPGRVRGEGRPPLTGGSGDQQEKNTSS